MILQVLQRVVLIQGHPHLLFHSAIVTISVIWCAFGGAPSFISCHMSWFSCSAFHAFWHVLARTSYCHFKSSKVQAGLETRIGDFWPCQISVVGILMFLIPCEFLCLEHWCPFYPIMMICHVWCCVFPWHDDPDSMSQQAQRGRMA